MSNLKECIFIPDEDAPFVRGGKYFLVRIRYKENDDNEAKQAMNDKVDDWLQKHSVYFWTFGAKVVGNLDLAIPIIAIMSREEELLVLFTQQTDAAHFKLVWG